MSALCSMRYCTVFSRPQAADKCRGVCLSLINVPSKHISWTQQKITSHYYTSAVGSLNRFTNCSYIEFITAFRGQHLQCFSLTNTYLLCIHKSKVLWSKQWEKPALTRLRGATSILFHDLWPWPLTILPQNKWISRTNNRTFVRQIWWSQLHRFLRYHVNNRQTDKPWRKSYLHYCRWHE